MYSNVTKDWSTSFSSIVSYKNILNISHMLYQLYYLIISFNLQIALWSTYYFFYMTLAKLAKQIGVDPRSEGK